MLLTLAGLIDRHDMKINGTLHLGAHLGEEAAEYHELGCEPVWWVEANPYVIETTVAHLEPYKDNQHLFHACVYDRDDVLLPFHVTNYDGMSSSIYEFGTHPQFSPDTVFEHHIQVRSTKVDTLAAQHNIRANFLNMDLQGAELPALKGAVEFLQGVDYVYTEVNTAEVYVGCTKLDALDRFLASDFDRVEISMVPDQGWGDALYIRRGR